MIEVPDVLSNLPRLLLPLQQEDGPGDPSPLTSLKPAAVLIILFPRGDEVFLLLTARPHTLSRHPGQIALPGGAMEPADVDLAATALRETSEELGVEPTELRLLGRLPSFSVLVSGYLIAPFVAWSAAVPVTRPDPREVAEVFDVPVVTLLDPSAIKDDVWALREGHWRVIYYRIGERQIWGATARILWDLAARLRGLDQAPELGPGTVLPA